MRKKKIEIWDLLPPEANRAIDELGYSFLAENGYDVANASTSKAKLQALKDAMKAKKEELRHVAFIDSEANKILFSFRLHRCGICVKKSKALQFVLVSEGEEDGKRKNQT